MFTSKSIRNKFLVQLLFASVTLIVVFSSLLYIFIERSILSEKVDELLVYAKNISQNRSLLDDKSSKQDTFGLDITLVTLTGSYDSYEVYESSNKKTKYITLIYPFKKENNLYLKIKKDITKTKDMLDKILHYIFIINVVGIVFIIVYAIALSNMLVRPIQALTYKLSNMNENLVNEIRIEDLPEEFVPLGNTINHLLKRIYNFIKYQKELFIGTAHELKTPLAVIKLKNQVTLIKQRTPKEYIDAIKTTNKTIDEMNIIVSNILNMGRQEGAQLEQPVQLDVIEFLKNKANDFKLLAENEGKELSINFTPDTFMATLQPSLLNQIIQNFLQNAIKFTPKGKKVELKSFPDDYGLCIQVVDEGCGIDESLDIFAPFKRSGDKSGVGLGLFLAKTAADALDAKISIKNRDDGIDGTVATLQIKSDLSCILPKIKK